MHTNVTIRKAAADDMPAIFMLGYDAWAEGASHSDYLAACQASAKYTLGQWYVLEHSGQIVSALISYVDAFDLPPGVVGIGSVATAAQHRQNGYASALLRGAMATICAESPVASFLLFSDIDPVMYEKLGFVRLSGEHQRYPGSVAMVRVVSKDLQSRGLAAMPSPRYF